MVFHLKIVHISAYAFSGGAGRAAYRLHDSLKRQNVDSSMIVGPWEKKGDSVVPIKSEKKASTRLQRFYRKLRIQWDLAQYSKSRPKGLELFSSDRSRYCFELIKAIPNCDVVNLHWISGFVDLSIFFKVIPNFLFRYL